MTEDSVTWVRVAALSDIGIGDMTAFEIGGRSIALYRLEDESGVFATDNLCTHALAYLTDGWLDGDVIECPLHGGTFNVRSGEGLTPPITCNLTTYPVRVSDGDILVGMPETVAG